MNGTFRECDSFERLRFRVSRFFRHKPSGVSCKLVISGTARGNAVVVYYCRDKRGERRLIGQSHDNKYKPTPTHEYQRLLQ